MDETHEPKLRSWVEVEENSDFPIQNIPFGVFCPKSGGDLHVATAIGDYVLDLALLYESGAFGGSEVEGTEVFHEPTGPITILSKSCSNSAFKFIFVTISPDNL